MNQQIEYFLAGQAAPLVVGALARTLHIEPVGREHFDNSLRDYGGLVFACLHGRMFIPVWVHRKDNITTLVSQSRDGELVARLVQKLGHRTIRGSSHRGAREGLRAMVEAGKSGPLAMMVDGPRGPREDPKAGVIAIARLAGLPIVPLAGAAVRAWEFHSWDRFQLPKPFSKAYVLYGEPLLVPRETKGEEALEAVRLDLKARLVALREYGDRLTAAKEHTGTEST